MTIHQHTVPARPIWKVIAIYALVAGLWIIASDWLLFQLLPDLEATYKTSLYKGLAFVATTSVLLYVLMHGMTRTIARIERDRLANELIAPELPALMASLPVQVYLLEKQRDGHYHPMWVSDNVTRITGYKPDETLAHTWWASNLHPDDREQALAESRSILLTGTGSHEYRFRCKNGRYMHVLDELRPVNHNDRRPYLVGTWADITQRKQTQREIEQYADRLESAMYSTVEAVARLTELRDPYTAGHEYRVGEIAAAIAALMGYDEHYQQGLRVGGLLHDIGKISVPSEILTKPSRLTDAEFALMQEHPANGYAILGNIDFPWPVAEMAYQHHERMDGSGYPQGLKGEQICMESRIIAVADVVESMANFRPYRQGLGVDIALDEIEKNATRLYDPDVANACVRLFREHHFTLPD